MRNIARPPAFPSSHKLDLELAQKYRAVDEKGRYLPWDELRHRIKKGENPEQVWSIVKFARLMIQKKLPLLAKNQSAFTFAVTDLMQQRLHHIDRICGPHLDTSLSNLSISPSHHERYLVDSLMMEEAITSSQLEGAATTRLVAKQMLEAGRAPHNAHEKMIFNNYLLMKESVRAKDQALTLELIRSFHQTATLSTDNPDVIPGEFRTTDDVVVEGRDREVVHQPPPADQINERMQALCDFANAVHDGKDGSSFVHPCVKATILHFMIGYEHPFADGNGRTARALFYWFMLKQGYWPFEYISISALLYKAPVAYGKSFIYTETDDFDMTYFLDYQLEIIERAIDNFLTFIKNKRQEQYEIMLWLEQTDIKEQLNYRQGLILKKAIRSPGREFTVKEVCSDFGVKENTARSDLKQLVHLGFLLEAKEGKSILYIARNDIVRRLKTA